jgi:hypothetical protein
MHPAIEVLERGAIHGRGLVATSPIRRGEVVWQMDPDASLVPCSEVAAWSAERREAFSYVATWLYTKLKPRGIIGSEARPLRIGG